MQYRSAVLWHKNTVSVNTENGYFRTKLFCGWKFCALNILCIITSIGPWGIPETHIGFMWLNWHTRPETVGWGFENALEPGLHVQDHILYLPFTPFLFLLTEWRSNCWPRTTGSWQGGLQTKNNVQITIINHCISLIKTALCNSVLHRMWIRNLSICLLCCHF